MDQLVEDKSRVCVVSLIGKSQLLNNQSKAWKLNNIIDKNVFKVDSSSNDPDYHEIDQNGIKFQKYYDRSKNVIYLHLESFNDCNDLISLFETKLKQSSPEKPEVDETELFELFQKEQTKFIRALLLVFSISHIIIVSNPSCSFDISYVRLFRIVDIFRNKMLPPLVDTIKSLNLPISKDWLYAARPCAPRVLFTFEDCPYDLLNETSSTYNADTSNKALEKLQHSLEDHIYQSLRKSYVITNISNNSLFAIPANQEFVYIHRYTHDLNLTNKFLMNSLIQDCLRFKDSRFGSSSFENQFDFNSNIFDLYKVDTRLFKKFLFEHVNLALKEGFNDNIGRNNVNPLFELPSSTVFFKLFDCLHDFFLKEPKSSKIQSYYNQIKTHVDIDAKYSENRCKKALPLALKAYNETLPSHFTQAQHQQRLERAIKVFDSQAKGSAYAECLQQLKEECEKIWMKSRACEAISLTGNSCLLELHRLPTDENEKEDSIEPDADEQEESQPTAEYKARVSRNLKLLNRKNLHERTTSFSKEKPLGLQVKIHNSSIVTLAASNCGEYQRERRDPFDLKEANYSFYAEFPTISLTKKKLVVYEFDTYKSKTENLAAEDLNKLRISESVAPDSLSNSRSKSLSPSNVNDFASKIVPREQKPINNKQNYENMFPPLPNNESENCQPSTDEKITQSESSIATKKEETTTELKFISILKGMNHSQTPPDQYPLYCSWSLVSIGKFADYNPNTGLTQPGFLKGHNYLIPWEIGVLNDTVIMLCEKPSRKNRNKQNNPIVRDLSSVLRFVGYIGMEYECPLGHRFICSGPDRIVKLSSNGTLKDDAYKLLYCDMPLYTACPCRDSKETTPYMAQMMRVYVITPASTACKPDAIISRTLFNTNQSKKLPTRLNIIMKPQVQPNPQSPIFFPKTNNTPINLAENSIWILRLPYIYMNDDLKDPYYRPKDFETLNNCKVFKGTFATSLS